MDVPIVPIVPVPLIKKRKASMALSSTATKGSASHAPPAAGAQNALSSYDITIWCDRVPDRDVVIKTMKEWCKKWTFQQEKGSEEGKLHWQCRVSLFKKKRIAEFRKSWPLEGSYITPTCNSVHVGANFNYAMKADTRVDGPWKDGDEETLPPMTRQLAYFMKQPLRPWQEKLAKLMESEDDRSVICVVDIDGNGGKSIFSEWMEYQGKAYEIPYMNDIQDIMQCVMSVKHHRAYIIDMPRGIKKEKLAGMYGGLETLKNGVAYDKRYAFKKRRFDRPQVVVFTNEPPQFNLLSADRWKVFCLQLHDLVKWEDRVTPTGRD